MTSLPATVMLNASLQLIGRTTSMAAPSNNQSDSPSVFLTNWSIPAGCTMVFLSQMDFSRFNYPDGVVSTEIRVFIQDIRKYMQIVLVLIGGPANVINMAVFWRQGIKDRVTLCLFFLSLSDGVFLIGSTVLQAEELYNLFTSKSKGIGPYLTFLINNDIYIFKGLYFVSPILSAIIAIERCLCVFNPLTLKTLIRTRTMATIIFFVYVSVFALTVPVNLRYRIRCLYDPMLNFRTKIAVESDFFAANKRLVGVMDTVLINVGMRVTSMTVVVVATVLTTVKLNRIIQFRTESTSILPSREITLTRMLIASSVLFIFCSSPYTTFNFGRLFFPEVEYGQKDHNLYLVCTWLGDALALIKACTNVFVYYATGSRFRETFWEMCGRKSRKRSSSTYYSHTQQ